MTDKQLAEKEAEKLYPQKLHMYSEDVNISIKRNAFIRAIINSKSVELKVVAGKIFELSATLTLDLDDRVSEAISKRIVELCNQREAIINEINKVS